MAHTPLLVLITLAVLTSSVQQRPTDDDVLLRGIQRLQGTPDNRPTEFVADRAPEPIRRVQPEYTASARAAKIEGAVVFDCIIDANGNLKILRVVRSIGYGLDQSAYTALQQWRFRPAVIGGKPASSRMNIEVRFTLPR